MELTLATCESLIGLLHWFLLQLDCEAPMLRSAKYLKLLLQKSARAILQIAILFSAGSLAEQQPLVFFTEHSPPGEYLDDQGKLTGATVELISHLMEKLDDSGNIHLQPWARAYKEALLTPHSVLFETTRNNDREDLFQWVGPLKIYQLSLYKKLDKNLPKDRQQWIACEVRGASFVDTLNKLGFKEGKNLVLTPKPGDCLEMIKLNRVHMTVLSEAAFFTYKDLHELELEPWHNMGSIELYMAFSKDVSPERVQRWQHELEQSYLDGTMRKYYTGVYSSVLLDRLEAWASFKTGKDIEHKPAVVQLNE